MERLVIKAVDVEIERGDRDVCIEGYNRPAAPVPLASGAGWSSGGGSVHLDSCTRMSFRHLGVPPRRDPILCLCSPGSSEIRENKDPASVMPTRISETTQSWQNYCLQIARSSACQPKMTTTNYGQALSDISCKLHDSLHFLHPWPATCSS